MSAPPYAGLKVLDLSQGIAGPYCAALLAQQGADVIKVEPPGGDWIRNAGGGRDGMTPLAIAGNLGKRSIVVDAQKSAGRDLILRMAASADVVIENNRPGVIERLGLGYEAIAAGNPAVVYVSITGFGPDGPDAAAGLAVAPKTVRRWLEGGACRTGGTGGRSPRCWESVISICGPSCAAAVPGRTMWLPSTRALPGPRVIPADRVNVAAGGEQRAEERHLRLWLRPGVNGSAAGSTRGMPVLGMSAITGPELTSAFVARRPSTPTLITVGWL